MALPPIRGIAALLQNMAKVGRGGRAGQLRRKPLLGKGRLDKELTHQGNFAKEMRATSRPRFLKSSPIPTRPPANPEWYGKAGPTGRRDMGWQQHQQGTDPRPGVNRTGPMTSTGFPGSPKEEAEEVAEFLGRPGHPFPTGSIRAEEPSGLRATYEPRVGRFPTPVERRAGARRPSARERREERTRMAKGMGVRRKQIPPGEHMG